MNEIPPKGWTPGDIPQGRLTLRGGRPWVTPSPDRLQVVGLLMGLDQRGVVELAHLVPEKVFPSLG